MTPGRRALASPMCANCVLAGTIVLGLAACADPGLPPGVVARVGEKDLSLSEFEQYVTSTTGEPADGLETAVLAGLFRQFLEEESLRQLAIEDGAIPASGSRWEAARALLAVQPPEIDEAELTRYRRTHADELVLPERLVARHMLFENRAEAEAARTRLLAGEPFESVLPSAVGAERIEVAFEDLPELYAGPLFELEAGAVSEILGDAHQHHLFQIVERLPAGEVPADEVRARLTRELEEQAVERQREQLLRRARERYHPQIARSRLPFPLAPEENPAP